MHLWTLSFMTLSRRNVYKTKAGWMLGFHLWQDNEPFIRLKTKCPWASFTIIKIAMHCKWHWPFVASKLLHAISFFLLYFKAQEYLVCFPQRFQFDFFWGRWQYFTFYELEKMHDNTWVLTVWCWHTSHLPWCSLVSWQVRVAWEWPGRRGQRSQGQG